MRMRPEGISHNALVLLYSESIYIYIYMSTIYFGQVLESGFPTVCARVLNTTLTSHANVPDFGEDLTTH